MKKTQLTARRRDWETVALPIVLMLAGIILLIGNWLGVLSLDRIQNLWPAAVIVIGLAELIPVSVESGPTQAFDRYQNENYDAR